MSECVVACVGAVCAYTHTWYLALTATHHSDFVFLFQVSLKGNRLADDVNLTQVALKLEGYTGSDIKEVCREAVVRISHEEALRLERKASVSTTSASGRLVKITNDGDDEQASVDDFDDEDDYDDELFDREVAEFEGPRRDATLLRPVRKRFRESRLIHSNFFFDVLSFWLVVP
jgi:SpoVK/Ycf46/Vps4 family AAA+-type ATPase